MKIGFTGTQKGMNLRQSHQIDKFLDFLVSYIPSSLIEIHHGDCIGADAEMHKKALREGFHIVIHPPINSYKRAFCKEYDEIRDPMEYLKRNHMIVDETEFLIATPATNHEKVRSGTWSTIRYTWKMKKDVKIFLPW